jgi:hypothetical protein
MKNLEPGPIEETTHHERLLSEVWDDLGGDEGGMTGQKLVGRMKHIEWHPPVLSFSIERHGGTVLGSTRAEVQQWCVDIDRQIASCESTGHRSMSIRSPSKSQAGSLTAKRMTDLAGSEMGLSGWRWARSSRTDRGTNRPFREGEND